MPKDFDLDQFKAEWQQENKTSTYEEEEILSILNKRSRGYVKLIAWISVAELLFFLILTIMSASGQTSDFVHKFGEMGLNVERVQEVVGIGYDVFKILGIFISIAYIFIFFSKFRKVRVESDIKAFMLQIMSFRKAVNSYIVLNVFLFLIFIVFLGVLPLYYKYAEHAGIDSHRYFTYIITLAIASVLGLAFLIIYYRLVYGILMHKLAKNLRQLEAIEELN